MRAYTYTHFVAAGAVNTQGCVFKFLCAIYTFLFFQSSTCKRSDQLLCARISNADKTLWQVEKEIVSIVAVQLILHRLSVVQVLFCSLKKGVTPKIGKSRFVVINSVQTHKIFKITLTITTITTTITTYFIHPSGKLKMSFDCRTMNISQ